MPDAKAAAAPAKADLKEQPAKADKKSDKAAAPAKPEDPNAHFKKKAECMEGRHTCCGPSVPLGIKHWYRDGAHRGGGGWLCDKNQWTMDTKYKIDQAHAAPKKAAAPKNPPGYKSQQLCEKKAKMACCEPFETFGIKSWHPKKQSVVKNGSKFDCGDMAPKWTLDAKYKPPDGSSHAAALAKAGPAKPINHKWEGKTVCVINGQNDQGCCAPNKKLGIKHWHGVGQHNFPKDGGTKYKCHDDLTWDHKHASKKHGKKVHAVPMGGNQGPGFDMGLRTH